MHPILSDKEGPLRELPKNIGEFNLAEPVIPRSWGRTDACERNGKRARQVGTHLFEHSHYVLLVNLQDSANGF
jgi:hypothetical protein